MVKVKRIYEDPATDDGFRVLVDRLWPRGVAKDEAELDDWAKELAPSDGLRKWFGHDHRKWAAFKARYRHELEEHPEAVDNLRHQAENGTVTLLYGSKDTDYNNAVVLKEYLESASS